MSLLLFQDDNRYNSSRGAHLNLKRAEKARILVNKIPGTFISPSKDSLYLPYLNKIWLELHCFAKHECLHY